MQSKQRATMSRWLVTGVLCVAAATACGDDGDGVNTLSLGASSFRNDSAVVHTRVTFPGFDRNFVDYEKLGAVTIPVFALSGTIRIQFARIKGQSDTIGRGEVSLKIRPGNVYVASFMRVPADLSGPTCFGCSGYQNFPMIGSARASTDSMHLSHTNAKPLCRGCVAQGRDSVMVVARKE